MGVFGYILNDKKTLIYGKGDISNIIKKFYKKDSDNLEYRKAKYFSLPFDEIKDNDYSLIISNYNEIEYEVIDYEPPEVIKRKILI
jgi:type I restriction enzyme M protein